MHLLVSEHLRLKIDKLAESMTKFPISFKNRWWRHNHCALGYFGVYLLGSLVSPCTDLNEYIKLTIV